MFITFYSFSKPQIFEMQQVKGRDVFIAWHHVLFWLFGVVLYAFITPRKAPETVCVLNNNNNNKNYCRVLLSKITFCTRRQVHIVQQHKKRDGGGGLQTGKVSLGA